MKQLRALYQRVGYTVSSFVLALSMVTAAVPFILSEGVGASPVTPVTPSTNDINKTKNWAHVNVESKTSSSVTFELVSTRNFLSCFEFRVDGLVNSDANPNTGVTDGYYPHQCVGNASTSRTVNASEYVEVRMVFGAETDERFGWTRFDVAPKPDIHSLRFSTINSSYKGIVIDQYLRNFTDATSYKATIHRADGSSVSREGGADTLNHINQGGNMPLTTPFNFAGSSDGPWFGPLDAVWLPNMKPVGVTIEVDTVSNGLITLSTPITQTLVEKSGSYNSLIPVYNPTTDINVSVNAEGLVGNKFTVSGDAYAVNGLNRVYVQLVNRENSQRYGGVTINLIGSGNSASWSHEYDASKLNLPEGNYAAHVEVVDMPGNRGTAGWTDNFRLDKTSPIFEMVTPANNDIVRGVQTIRAKITDANDIKKVLVNVGDGKGNYVWEDGKTNNKVTRDGDEFYIDIDTTTLPEGVNYVVLRATDGAGNTRYWNNNANTRQHSYVVDNTSPVVSISGVSDGGVYRGPVTVSGLVEDANHSHFYLTVTKDGVNQTISGATGKRTADSFEFDLSDEGVYTIKLEARDLAGNKGPESTVELSFTIDNTAPVLTLNGGDVTLTVGDLYVEQGATASDVVDGSLTDNIVIDSSLVNTGVVGSYVVTYTVADEAGNTSTATRTVTVVEPAPQTGGEETTDDDDDEDELVEVAAVLFPAGFANIVDTNPDLTPDTEDAEDADQDVAGATTDNAAQVAGASDDASWLGLAWYWWVLIAAAVLGAGWWLAGAIRRRGAEAEA